MINTYDDMLSRILVLLKESGKEQKDLTAAIGVYPSTVTDWKNGKSKSYKKYADAIADFFGVTVDYLLGKSPVRHSSMEIYEASERDTVPIPIVGNVAAGYQAYAATDIVGYELVESSIISDGFEYAWLKVKGDSMSPLILENDLVLVRLQDEVESGDLAVVIVDEEDGVIKRVQFGMNKVTLVSENAEKYPPRVFTGKESSHIRIWGKAIDLKRKLV